MNPLQEQSIQCPYCWEHIHILIDCTLEEQDYIEDCQVCCQPIIFKVRMGAENAEVQVSRDGD